MKTKHQWYPAPNADVWRCGGCDLEVTGEKAACCPNRKPRTYHAPCALCDPHPNGPMPLAEGV